MVQRIFTKGTKTMNGEKIIFSINRAGKTGYLHVRRWGWTPALYYIHQLTQNGVKDLNLRTKTIKLLQETENLHYIGSGSDFLGMKPKAKATKEKKLDASEYIKTKNFCVKPTIIRVKRWSIEWEQIFPIYIPDNSSVQLLSRVRLFATLWTAAYQASLSITNSWSPPKPMSIESVMPSNHLILLHPLLLLPQSFPASGSFPMS